MSEKAQLSRADFLKGTALGALGFMGANTLVACGAEGSQQTNASSTGAPARVVDVHAHLLPAPMNTEYVSWLQETNTLDDGPFFLWTDSAFEDVENHVSEMDRFGIDAEVVTFSSNAPNIVNAAIDAGASRAEAVQNLNDGLLEISRASNDRIITSSWIDPSLGNEALVEMNRAAEAGTKAFGILTGYAIEGKNHYMDYPAFEDFWSEANKIGLPIFTHFSTKFPISDPDAPLTGFSTENVMNGGVSVLAENTVAATRLVFSGILDKYDNLKIVLGQLGGFFPWMFGRYELLHGIYSKSAEAQGVDYQDEKNLDTYLRNLKDYANFFWLDSHSMSQEDIACAMEIMGTDRVMFGSDYPITPAGLGREKPLATVESFPADTEAREAFYHGNIEKLLNI